MCNFVQIKLSSFRLIKLIDLCDDFLKEISKTGKLRFYNEEEVIKREAIKLKDEGVDIIIVLSHCGLDVDYRIAKGKYFYIPM